METRTVGTRRQRHGDPRLAVRIFCTALRTASLAHHSSRRSENRNTSHPQRSSSAGRCNGAEGSLATVEVAPDFECAGVAEVAAGDEAGGQADQERNDDHACSSMRARRTAPKLVSTASLFALLTRFISRT